MDKQSSIDHHCRNFAHLNETQRNEQKQQFPLFVDTGANHRRKIREDFPAVRI